jgi:hypothetical protein
MSDAIRILMQHLENKERKKEREDDKLYDLVRIAEAREYQESITKQSNDLKLQSDNINNLRQEVRTLQAEKRGKEDKLVESKVDLNLVNELAKTDGAYKILETITSVNSDNMDLLESNLLGQIDNLNIELDTMTDVLTENVEQATNIIEGGILSQFERGEGFGSDITGLDPQDFGYEAFQTLYAQEEPIESNYQTTEDYENALKEFNISNKITKGIFDLSGADIAESLREEKDWWADYNKKLATSEYYQSLTTTGIQEESALKAAQYEVDIKGYIRDSNINLGYNTMLQQQEWYNDDNHEFYQDEELLEKIDQTKFQIAHKFIVTQGLEDDFKNLLSKEEQLAMIDEYYEIYENMVLRSHAETAVREGTVVKSNIEDYYFYLDSARQIYEGHLKDGNQALADQIAVSIKEVFGTPKLMTLDNFFKNVESKYSHIEGMIDTWESINDPGGVNKNRKEAKEENLKLQNQLNRYK